MRPALHDFDVITDTPRGAQAPRRRLPEPTEQPPRTPTERADPVPQQEAERVRAAE